MGLKKLYAAYLLVGKEGTPRRILMASEMTEFTRLIYVTISIVDNELFTSSSWRFPPSLMEHVRLSQFSGIECLNFNFLK